MSPSLIPISGARFRWQAAVDGGSRADDERLHPAEARRHRRQLEARREGVGNLPSAGVHERQHPPETAAEQAGGPGVLGVRGQAGIVDLGDLGAALEEAGDLKRARRLPAHPEADGLEPAFQQHTRVRIERATEMVEREFDPAHPFR